MTKKGKRELLEAIRPRYLRASKAEKTRILVKQYKLPFSMEVEIRLVQR